MYVFGRLFCTFAPKSATMFTGIPNVLTITGSDCTGGSGIQADIKTITALGGYAVTAITSVTVQDSGGIRRIHDLDADMVAEQVRSVMDEIRPQAVKIGMVRDVAAIQALCGHVVGCSNIVCDPGFLSSHGTQLMPDEAIDAVRRFLVPESSLLLLRCNEAERLLGMSIATDDDMAAAAGELTTMGARAVLLRGGHQTDGMLTALFCREGRDKVFYRSCNTEGWQRHGVGGALSTAVATRLAFGDDIATAIQKAHDYMHRQVVYAVVPKSQGLRPADLYNQFMSLIAQHYCTEHSVAFYADAMAISTRYLSQITEKVIGKPPKQLIADYIMQEARMLLGTSSMTVQEISDKLGFSSQSLFSSFFHAQQGCSPKEYRTL